MKKIRSKFNFPLARSTDSAILAELFLVNSIFSIVVIRVFLFLTDYPQLGGGVLHIAHMLWGGLLMFISIAFLLFLHGRSTLFIAAVIGGLGFGTFIDELGKFITSDNDYFFQPTFALIYLLFVCMFFIFRYAFVTTPLRQREYLTNASYLLAEIISTHDYDEQDKMKLQELLEQAGATKGIKNDFYKLAKNFDTNRKTTPSLYIRIRYFLKKQYVSIIQTKWFPTFIKTLFALRAIVITANVLLFLFNANFGNFDRSTESLGFFEIGAIISSFAVNGWVLWGLLKFKESGLTALKKFRTSTLIAILFYTFFSFYFNQLLAILGLCLEILILYALELMISSEEQ